MTGGGYLNNQSIALSTAKTASSAAPWGIAVLPSCSNLFLHCSGARRLLRLLNAPNRVQLPERPHRTGSVAIAALMDFLWCEMAIAAFAGLPVP